MTWEIVIMLVVLTLVFTLASLFLAAIGNMIANDMNKRRIEMHKAGIMPKGWKMK